MRSLTKKFVVSNRLLVAISCLVVVFIAIILAARVGAAPVEPTGGERLITIHESGQERGILTSADTLRQAFEQAGIEIEEHDLVEPGLDEELVASHYEANIYRARPVTVIDDQVRTRIMTPYQTAEQIVKDAGLELREEDNTTLLPNQNIVAEGAGLSLTIDRATEFTLFMYGKETTAYTQAETVGAMLDQKGIELGDKDSVSVALSTPIEEGMEVELYRDGKQTVTVEETIDKSIREIRDTDREIGYREIKTAGQDGTKQVTYEIIMKNGEEVSRKEINSITTKQPVEEQVVVGAKFNYTGGSLNEEQITFLGNCESGMNPTTNTGNGFTGAFQFMDSTWNNVHHGPYSSAYQAPLDVQKQAVQDLLSGSSIFTQFPSCANQMRDSGLI